MTNTPEQNQNTRQPTSDFLKPVDMAEDVLEIFSLCPFFSFYRYFS